MAENQSKRIVIMAKDMIKEEDGSYMKDVLESKQELPDGELDIEWDFVEHQLVFDLQLIAVRVRNLEPIKRHMVSIATRFYDPLRFITPVMSTLQ